jgi:hypothetical protein
MNSDDFMQALAKSIFHQVTEQHTCHVCKRRVQRSFSQHSVLVTPTGQGGIPSLSEVLNAQHARRKVEMDVPYLCDGCSSSDGGGYKGHQHSGCTNCVYDPVTKSFSAVQRSDLEGVGFLSNLEECLLVGFHYGDNPRRKVRCH